MIIKLRKNRAQNLTILSAHQWEMLDRYAPRRLWVWGFTAGVYRNRSRLTVISTGSPRFGGLERRNLISAEGLTPRHQRDFSTTAALRPPSLEMTVNGYSFFMSPRFLTNLPHGRPIEFYIGGISRIFQACKNFYYGLYWAVHVGKVRKV